MPGAARDAHGSLGRSKVLGLLRLVPLIVGMGLVPEMDDINRGGVKLFLGSIRDHAFLGEIGFADGEGKPRALATPPKVL